MASGTRKRGRKRYYVLGVLVVAIGAVIAFWDWDWFIPLADAQASRALGRQVTIQHLHLQLARRPIVEADGIVVANPDGFPESPPLASVGSLRVRLDVPAYLHDRSIVIPSIAITNPAVELREQADGKNNWSFPALTGAADSGGASAPAPKIGDLEIMDGHAHVLVPAMKSDFTAAISTRAEPDGKGKIVVDARGTYAGQPITGTFMGGALLSLRDASDPYPVDLHVANGPTHVALVGTLQDPLKFAGADLKLDFSGPDLSLLYPLTGVPIPQTPSYQLSGRLDYADKRIRFRDIAGRVGSSDLEGEIDVQPGTQREMVTANLASKRIDLADLGGFIGSTPGRVNTPDQTPAQRQAVVRAEASPRLIPNVPLNVPRLRVADIDLHYRGAHIEGRSVPLDDVIVALKITDGNIDLHPISFGIGRGHVSGDITLDNVKDVLHAKAAIDVRQVDLARIMASTHTFAGAGLIGGTAAIDGTGNSLAALLDHGNGDLKLFMGHGGDISALLVDLSGLEFGNALMSALGIPNRATLNCMVTDFALHNGVVSAQTMLLDTSEANVTGAGSVNLRDEDLDLTLRTQAKHFSIGSLPAPIDIRGTFKDPSIRPDAAILGARVGAAVGLGILLTPLAALIPTIQLGLGEDNDCARLIHAGAVPTAAARAAR